MVKVKKQRGRPPFKPTRQMRQKVERYTMCQMTQLQIAQALGISLPTLTKHFVDELQYGASRQRGQVVDMLFRSADDGNVSAQRKLIQMADGETIKLDSSDEETSEKKLGKKEQQALDAHDVGDKFQAPEPPKLVVNNNK